MANSEDYLDSLLNAVLGNETGFTNVDEDENDIERAERELLGNIDAELRGESADDFLEEFDRELAALEAQDAALDEDVPVQNKENSSAAVTEKPLAHAQDIPMPDMQNVPPLASDEKAAPEASSELDDVMGGVADILADDSLSAAVEAQKREDDALVDKVLEENSSSKSQAAMDALSQMEGLGDDLELEDISNILKAAPDAAADIIEAKSEPKPKKKGLFAALFAKLFSNIDGEEDPTPEEEAAMAEEMKKAKEQYKIDKAAEKEAKKAEKDAKKAEKKAESDAKKAEKAAAKAAKEAEKPKKVKPPKPPKKPIKKKPIIVGALFIASCVILVNMSMKLISYQYVISESRSSYYEGDYIASYESLFGVSVKESDEDHYQSAKLMAGLQYSYGQYENLLSIGKLTGAVDALIGGIGKYSINEELAASLGISEEYDALKDQITDALGAYGISYDDALEMYEMRDRDDYTVALLKVLSD